MRFHYIDQLRAFAILLIVFEHSDHNSLLSMFSTSFSVPIFFIISGMLSKSKEALSFGVYFKKLLKRLLVPYFALSTLLFVFWFFLGRNYGESALKDYDPIKNFIGIFYGQGGAEYMNWGIPMWFLLALFCIYSIDFLVSRWFKKRAWIFAFLFPLFGYFLSEMFTFSFPWSIDIAFAMYGFYFFGKYFYIKFGEQIINLKWWLFPITILLITLHLSIFSINGRILYYYSRYGNFALMYLLGILGFLWAYIVFRFIPKVYGVSWIGKNTIPVLAFHLLAMSMIKAFFIYVLKINIILNAYNSLLLAVIQILICIPVIWVINRYLPEIVGNSR